VSIGVQSRSNNSMQRTALRAAADAERSNEPTLQRMRPLALAVAIILVALAFGSCKPAATSPPQTAFFGRKISDSGPAQPRPLILEFHEVGRSDKTSVVRHKFTSGASVASSMWFMRCTCALARARGATHFIVLSSGPGDQVIGFANSGSVDPLAYFGQQPEDPDLGLQSVAEFERLFGDSSTLGPAESEARLP